LQEDDVTTRSREPGPFARRLATLRWSANLGRDELAELSGVSADLIQSLEQGRTANPTLRTLLGLAQSLGVAAAELIEGLSSEAGDGQG
jgi:transcriptional regulator with XRE-family HTH domain